MARRSTFTRFARSLLAVDAVADPPERVTRDWWFVAAIVLAAAIEGLVRPDLTWRPVAVLIIAALSLTVLMRRTHPLAMTAVAFGTVVTLDAIAQLVGSGPIEIYASAFLLVFPYCLLRWGSGRDAVLGVVITFVPLLWGLVSDWQTASDSIGGTLVVLLPAAIGIEVRHLVGARRRRLEDAQGHERQLLARELHDTVAHHVSAIAVQAQAGRVVGATDPTAAFEALANIERSASRTLAEMRGIVSALRGAEAAELAPQPEVSDIALLASSAHGTPPTVHVSITGSVDDVASSVGAAVYRIAQESITNARRHATSATRIDVAVAATDTEILISVTDDGATTVDRDTTGFGIVGMTERAHLLGGTFQAGPQSGGGWKANATIPLDRMLR